MLYGKYGYSYDMSFFGTVAYSLLLFCLYTIYFCECDSRCGFIVNILGAVFSIPLVYPYLKDQIIGPDYRIIQCDKIDSLGSWQDQWCSHHQRLSYKISKLWVIYQYQYRKGLFLTWLKEQKEKSRQQQIEPATAKNVKNDMVNKEINTVEIVATG
ncbi:hypothetical protein C2G38_2242311 [Gigaspora rosea]|uniref:Uncharacterized protein n=1 Tax=Gigaspora rosea TaxID=44941 RepID=A0A397VN89_9GLOM|nr:hypothetical protein C2G38_2242311 [Gigaspora rosea]